MRVYLLCMLFVIFSVGVFGFAGPMLISSPSTEACLLGMAMLIIAFPLLFYFIKLIIKESKK